jgi:hypothetical protein
MHVKPPVTVVRESGSLSAVSAVLSGVIRRYIDPLMVVQFVIPPRSSSPSIVSVVPEVPQASKTIRNAEWYCPHLDCKSREIEARMRKRIEEADGRTLNRRQSLR